ncbi:MULTISPECIES: signal peptide peptidase SppA [Frankia]|uniref:Endopeptidase IV (Protease IV, signal peptide peptidase) n=1 Tax=Frankia alni (strain DSM 45986 / CECT 9034 / ACN14a) TaxID=326424 RepID=Q0RCG7_FRAAA|nr:MULTISPECIES: signal peptide peptidase SppA [Frankia]CAJ64857.1 Endopeptidase IV (Protease IV, signal peptide peptidase) [Frankia alni ACN14a]
MAATPRKALADVRQIAARRTAPIVLELDLTVDPLEGVPSDPVTLALAHRRTTLRDLVEALRYATEDPRVSVVVAHIGAAGTPLARIQEIRAAIGDFRAAGGTAIAYADTFGEFGGGTGPYYLACAFDEIWLAPSGDCGLTGLGMETPFLRGALDRLGVAVEIGQRYEYKNAVNTLVERDFTPAHLEAVSRIIESSSEQVVAGIAQGRRMPADRVRRLIDLGPLAGSVALDVGLVDRLGYRDEVYAAARARVRRSSVGEGSSDTGGSPAGNGSPAGSGSSVVGGSPVVGGSSVAGPADADLAPTADTDLTAAAGPSGGAAATKAGDAGAEPVLMYATAYRRLAERREKSPVRRVATLTARGPGAFFLRETSPAPQQRSADGVTGSTSGRAGAPDDGATADAQGVPLAPSVTAPHRDPRRSVVALIHGTGQVILGPGNPGPFGSPVLAAEAAAAAFRAAARDEDVAAAVFRVNSPGGSYVASDLVRREAERFRASGRPLVVSMGDVAASGGYFVSLAADLIVANPGTLTGSIGVFAGKQVVRELLDKVGVGFGAVAEGEHALMMSPRRPFTVGEREKLEEFLDRVYADFVDKVAAARRLTRDQVHELARGRVWTGADAHAYGLVDELGGLTDALRLAWTRAGLPEGETPRVRLAPRPSVLERVRTPKSSEDRGAAATARPGLLGALLGGSGAFGGAGGLLGAALSGGSGALAAGGLLGVAGLGGSGAFGGAGASGGAGGLGGFAAGWGPWAPLAARLGLPVGGPLMMPPIGRIG